MSIKEEARKLSKNAYGGIKGEDYVPFIPATTVMPEMTGYSIILGVILAIVFAAANTYLGLKVGLTISAGIPGAILATGVFKALFKRNNILEANFAASLTAVGESIAGGIIFILPALILFGMGLSIFTVIIVTIIGGFMGCFFITPVRKYLIGQTHINVMVDYGLDRVNLFGPGILLDATFYTLDKSLSNKDAGVYFNITANLQEKFKKDALNQAYTDFCNGRQNARVYQLPQSKLKDIKSYPFIYWISDEFREKFGNDSIEEVLKPAQGAATRNNNRFLRYWWEVSPTDISNNYKKDRKKWVGYSKGGPYQKWIGNNWLLLNWDNDGQELKEYNAVLRNSDYYFVEGITYSASGSKETSFRYHNNNSTQVSDLEYFDEK